ncbi:triosephosphate isomerase [Bathymodiolus platifrons methanotrophic gill symbiont]|uniref:triose-phosphate isomerase n=1 Tax=Bathymodiolus platifrons methanotrophic gill symbiont TaxID=113268 RepID=UPI000B410771|nr:triose-phosphate isomerase [Bathymodiolus platifrons methanotrophic gill symbiont]TXK98118.1 triose-phosphate isomerase [Methylococcaceae bacterium CS4]TXK99634.1 triose-phosphate isomerase [Methylococcaceae bacterium CS5]TXL05292.1 triose-phosphate isomerase [Methylococcaceae bacterium CS1]TXL07997.1 triose-phosphate isomerase [Methylococcaceae bacterium CS3]TXL11803.1 triose-phosphate isomerase [Methylococcaceae bacterium CS2]TXL14981.1 triose-phosphate isomerase [Methylococcaceae bacter
MRRNLVVGNWKMKINHQSAQDLIDGLIEGLPSEDADIAVCPPYLYIPEVSQRLANTAIELGAQNVATHQEGAYTGEIAAVMLKDFNCKYAIVGHSERRANYADTDTTVAQRFQQAIDADLIPVLAVGELLEQRENGTTFEVVAKQLNAVLEFSGIDSFKNAVIAYEPVWAIGTGLTASAEQAQEVHLFIRQLLAEKNQQIAEKIQILYGGSVKPQNAEALFAMPDIDGALVGGDSLSADSFLKIYSSFQK